MNDNAVLTRNRVPYRAANSCLIIHLGERQIYFNEKGARIWELLDGHRTVAAIAAALYDDQTSLVFNRQALAAVKTFLADLVSKGLLQLSDPGDSVQEPKGQEAAPVPTQEATQEVCQYGQSKSTRERILQCYWDRQLIEKLHLELTYRCNLRCRHCYNHSHSGASRELTTKQWFHILTDAAELGCYSLVFTGGEPFARRDILEILQKACELGYAFRINTNGSMIRERDVPLLRQMTPFLQGIDISFYGPTAEIHDQVTSRPGSYVRTRAVLDWLLQANVPVVAKYVTMRMNFTGLQGFENEMRAKKIPCLINTGSLIPQTDRNPAPLAQLLTDDQYRQLLTLRGDPKGGRDSTNCIPGWNRGALTADGFVTPCEWLGDLKLGNVRDNDLKKIWYGPEFRQLRESLLNKTRACSECTLKSFCCSCPAHAYLETASLFHCPPVQRHNAEICRTFFAAQA
jgi:radical SAM protein with 4Fe4S-binding SPASM domain